MTAIILDTETTDREAGREIIEAAWQAIQPAEDLGGVNLDAITRPLMLGPAFLQRYKPSKPCTFGSLAVHHILPEELEGCPLASEFRLPAGVTYLIGHSIDFDWESIGKPDVKRICTCAMAKALWPSADSHSQSALLYMLNGPTHETRRMLKDAHSAAADVANNLVLLGHILDAKPEITTWSALWAFSEEARIPTVMFMGRNKGTPIADLDSGEIEWYLARDFIDPYQRQALEREMRRRRAAYATSDYDDEDIEEEAAEDGDVSF
jgi:exodeoxyribonuclease X